MARQRPSNLEASPSDKSQAMDSGERFGYRSHGLIPVLREAQLYFVINEIQVDNSVDVGLIVANRAFYCRDFCGAWSDVEYTDFIRRNTLVEIFFTGEDGC